MHRAVLFFMLLLLHLTANSQSVGGQGQFKSKADQASLRHALTATLGDRFKLSNPGDSSGQGDGSTNDQFGNSVAISGDTALVGAYSDGNLRGDFAGAVYVFVRAVTGWRLQAKLTASDGAAYDGLGSSVSISGNTAVLGAKFDDTEAGANTGSAYVFIRENGVWIEQAKIVPADATAGDHFGTSVALEENTTVIGAELAGATGAAYVYTRTAKTWDQQAKLLANDGATNDRFGVSVALSGNTAVVGASRDQTPAGLFVGSAYVFTRARTQWTQQTKLTANNAASYAQFGAAVAVFSDDILIGAPYANPDSRTNVGSAYSFVRNDGVWRQRAVLIPSDAPSYALFGNSLAIDGNTSVIGAYLEDGAQGVEAGASYVYTKSLESWVQQARITGSSADRDRFGASVAISGHVILGGVPLDDTAAGENAGSAIVFEGEGNQWNIQSQLTAGKGATRDWFGYAIAVYGDTAIVGAHVDDTVAENAGAVYVFTRSNDTWQPQAKLTASDGSVADLFGISVALWQDTALIGASLDSTSTVANAGSAYVFVRTNDRWQQQAKLMSPNASSGDNFGSAVALSENTALIGAPNKNSFNNASAGSAYVFVKTNSVWSVQSQLSSDKVTNSRFGWSVATAGDTALVGAIGANGNAASQSGAVSVFERTGSTWSSVAKLTADDAATADLFGYSISLSGDAVLIGAQSDDTESGINSGSAYFFTKVGSSWAQRFKLTPRDAMSNQYFGVSVALNGNQALIGAHHDLNNEGGTPAAYLFTQRNLRWQQDVIYKPEPWALNGWFGWSVALLDGSAFVSAHREQSLLTGNAEVGSVAIFDTGFRDGFEPRNDTLLLLPRH